jgi:NAD(P)-dependent dehydrogenase (short-subunit alcohol dehydrogenase family)
VGDGTVSAETSNESGRTAVVLGGTSGIGKEVARFLANRGAHVVLSGRTNETADAAAKEIGHGAVGIALDLAEPETIAAALADVGPVDELVIAAIERDANNVKTYNIAAAIRLVTLKLVGYTEVVHTLSDRFTPTASVVLFGGLAMERPYPGSTTVSTVNGGVTGLVRSLASELAPTRINAIHPGIIGDSPAWAEKDNSHIISRTPLGRLVTMDEIVDAVVFLLDNGGVNGVNIALDGGWLLK